MHPIGAHVSRWLRLGVSHEANAAIADFITKFSGTLQLRPSIPGLVDALRNALAAIGVTGDIVPIRGQDFFALSPRDVCDLFGDNVIELGRALDKGAHEDYDIYRETVERFIAGREWQFWQSVKESVPGNGQMAGECYAWDESGRPDTVHGSLQTHVFVPSITHALYLPIAAYAANRPNEVAGYTAVAEFVRLGNPPVARRWRDRAVLVLTA